MLEEDFGRTMHKLAATSQMAYTANECKAGYVYLPFLTFMPFELSAACIRLGGCDCWETPAS